MRVSEFDFELPDELIATRPASPRDSARLMVVRGDQPEDFSIRDLPEFLRAGDVLVLNDTRVIPARLRGKRGEVAVEILLHRPVAADGGGERWLAFARPGKRLKEGGIITISEDFSATVREKREGGEVLLEFDCSGEAFRRKLDTFGEVPLPPYIEKMRRADAQDRQDYQTVFAEHEGSVAAPTAGLHFTPEILEQLKQKGVALQHVTLHVGAGTFLPVKADDTDEHVMHAEWAEISPEVASALNAARAAGGRIVAVGTTSLRTLESATTEQGEVQAFRGETDIFITPGYRFRAVDVLMTNFHLPKSTLFMLVSAFSGLERMKGAYAHAITSGYRFYSYGDGCLLFLSDSEQAQSPFNSSISLR